MKDGKGVVLFLEPAGATLQPWILLRVTTPTQRPGGAPFSKASEVNASIDRYWALADKCRFIACDKSEPVERQGRRHRRCPCFCNGIRRPHGGDVSVGALWATLMKNLLFSCLRAKT